MGFFVTFLIFAAVFVTSAVIHNVLGDVLKGPSTDNKFEIRTPQTGEGHGIAILYGRVRHNAPSVMWFGDLRVDPIQEEVSTGIFSSEESVIGYKVFAGFQFGLCLSDGDVNLHTIYFGEAVITPSLAAADGNGTQWMAFQKFIGGRGKGGQVSTGGFADSYFYNGSSTQVADAYLVAQLGSSEVPGHRGIAYVTLGGIEIGESTSIPGFAFECSRYPSGLSSGVEQVSLDANPAEVLYDLLTNPWVGIGLDSARIDTTSFSDAATTLYNEGHGISLVFTGQEDASQVLGEIQRQIDGVIYEEPSTRELTLSLIREDYSVGSLPIFDESNTIELVELSAGTWAETYNQVRVAYNDRTERYETAIATESDGANFQVQGKVRSIDLAFPYVTGKALAQVIAARELKTLSLPLMKARLVVNRDGFALRPGSPFVFNWTELGLSGVVMRVVRFDAGTLEDGRIAIDCVQDQFSTDKTVYAQPGTRISAPYTPLPTTVDDNSTVELPWWMGLQAELRRIVDSADDSHMMFFAKRGTSADASEQGFHRDVSADGGSNYARDSTRDKRDQAAPFTESAQVNTAYDRETGPYDTTTGLVIKSVTDSSILASATSTEIRAGANLILAGSEFLSYESVTDNMDGTYTLNNVWRGMMDTVPQDHAADERVWFVFNTNLSAVSGRAFEGTESCKVLHITTTGTDDLDPGDATAASLTLVKRAQKPLPAANVTADGVNAYPGSDVGGENWVVTGEVTMDWERRVRTSTSLYRQNDGDDTPDEGERYFCQAKLDSESTWETYEGGFGAGVDGATYVMPTYQVASGAGAFRVKAGKEADSGAALSVLIGNFAYEHYELPARFAAYRQLLVNPGFDHATGGRAWDTIQGTPAWTTDSSAYRGTGTYLYCTTASSPIVEIEQELTIDHLSPVGLVARLVGYTRNISTDGTERSSLTIIARDSGGSDLGSATTGTLTPSTGSWDRATVSYTLPASTARIAIRCYLEDTTGGAATAGAAWDDLDLRIGTVSSDQVSGGGFDASLTGWTATNMSAQAASGAQEGAYIAHGDSAATCSMHQDTGALPGGFGTGDVAVLRCVRWQGASDDTGEVILEARDSGGSVLDSATTGAEGTLDDGTGHRRELYLPLPASTDHFRVRFEGVRVTGTPLDAGWDDVSLELFDLT